MVVIFFKLAENLLYRWDFMLHKLTMNLSTFSDINTCIKKCIFLSLKKAKRGKKIMVPPKVSRGGPQKNRFLVFWGPPRETSE